jgi:hypothetical protein
MNLSQDDLNALAISAFKTNTALLKAQDAFRRGDQAGVGERLSEAQKQNAHTWRSLERHGADDPYPKVAPERHAAGLAFLKELEEEDRRAGRTTSPAPNPLSDLTRMDSPANRRLLDALKVAQAAARDVELERGEEAALSESLADMAALVEAEVCGPMGLRGMEGR